MPLHVQKSFDFTTQFLWLKRNALSEICLQFYVLKSSNCAKLNVYLGIKELVGASIGGVCVRRNTCIIISTLSTICEDNPSMKRYAESNYIYKPTLDQGGMECAGDSRSGVPC